MSTDANQERLNHVILPAAAPTMRQPDRARFRCSVRPMEECVTTVRVLRSSPASVR